MKHYLKPTFVLAGALLTASSFLNAGTSVPVATDPVGYVSTTLVAGQHLFSTPLIRSTVISGAASGVSGADITISSPPTIVASNPLYLVVTSGTAAGNVETIISADATTITLENAITGFVATDQFQIREHFTVGDITAAAVAASDSLTSGDIITQYNSDGSSEVYTFNGGNWFLSGGGFTPLNEGIVFPNEGFVISLNSDTDFTFTGDVTTFSTNVDLTNSTFFIVSNNDPSSQDGVNSLGAALDGLGDGSVITVYSNDGNLTSSETYTLNGGGWFLSGGGFTPVEVVLAAPSAVVVNSQTNVSVAVPAAFSN